MIPVFVIEIEIDACLLCLVTSRLKPSKPRKLAKNVAKQDDEVNATEQNFKMCFFGPLRVRKYL